MPCPRARARASGEYKNPVGGGHPQFGGFFSGRVFTDDIEPTRISPYVKAATGVPVARNLGETPTFGRFCQQNVPLEYDCHADPSIRDSALTDFSSAAGESADPERPWHRVTLGANGLNREVGWSWPYNNTTLPTHKWAYGSDWTFWQAGGRIPPAESGYQSACSNTQLVGNGTCLDGALWYHASTAVGNTNAYANGQLVGIHGAGLANYYFDSKPDRAYAKTYAGTGLMRKLFFLIHTLPDPAPYESVLRSRVRPLVAAAELDVPHVMEDHGGSWAASSMISYVTANTLQSAGVVWAGAIEPSSLATNLDPRVQAMALSEDGTTVLDTTLLDRGTLISASELGYPHSSSGAVDAPSPRYGFVAVLSRQVGGVFVIGGRDLVTGEQLSDIHLFRPEIGWSTVTSGGGFATVKAATFSPTDGKLWVLERRASSYTLFRFSPWTGQADQLGTWTRGSLWDQHFLAIDSAGQVLLVAASRTNQRSKVGRLGVDANGAAYVALLDNGAGNAYNVPLPYTTSSPIVDKDEYGFIVRDASGAVTSILRRPSLMRSSWDSSLGHFFQ